VKFIEVAKPLRIVNDVEHLETEALPSKGDIVWLFDQNRERQVQFHVVERHWNIGNMVGIIEIYVCQTSEGAKTL